MAGVQDFFKSTMNHAVNRGGKNATIMEANKPIMRVGGETGQVDANWLGGIHGSIKNMSKDANGERMGMMDAVKTAHMNQDGSKNWGAIAGSALTAGVGMRVLSGGGIYKDGNGNTDVAGLPFI